MGRERSRLKVGGARTLFDSTSAVKRKRESGRAMASRTRTGSRAPQMGGRAVSAQTGKGKLSVSQRVCKQPGIGSQDSGSIDQRANEYLRRLLLQSKNSCRAVTKPGVTLGLQRAVRQQIDLTDGGLAPCTQFGQGEQRIICTDCLSLLLLSHTGPHSPAGRRASRQREPQD